MINSQHIRTQDNFSNRTVAVLYATPFDEITQFLSTLLDEFPDLGVATRKIRSTNARTYKELIDDLVFGANAEVALVFAGHGTDESLLGPPEWDGHRYSCFYDEGYFELGPAVLVAFCCSAGAVLGDAFRRSPTRAFIGFSTPIGFVMEPGVYSDCWKKILHQSTLRIIAETDGKVLEAYIRRLFEDAYSYFNSADGQRHEWSFWMTLLLRGQLDSLRVHARESVAGQTA